MGMSASQCRLLSLTARLSDLEYQAQSIDNAKIRLSDNAEDAANEYSAALDLQKLTVYSSDTSSQIDASAYNLTTFHAVSSLDKQRFLVNNAGQVLVSESIKKAYDDAVGTATSQTTDVQAQFKRAIEMQLVWKKGLDAIPGRTGKGFPTFYDPDTTDDTDPSFLGYAIWDNNRNSSSSQQITAQSPNYDKYVEYYKNVYSGLEGFLNQQGLTSNNGLTINNTNLDPVTTSGSLNTKSNRNLLVYDAEKVSYYSGLYNAMNSGNALNDETEISATETTFRNNILDGTEAFLRSQGCTSDPDYTGDELSTDASMVKYFTNLYDEINEKHCFTESAQNMADPDWLYQQLQNGTLYIENWDYDAGEDGTGDFVKVPWESGDTSLKQVDDNSKIAKAQAEYDLKMARIESKDKKYDLQLKQIDTEHTAVQTEVDSVKKVIDKNIERSFKIFDA